MCLIVKDLEKGLKIDHEPTVNHFNELLNEKGIDEITQVISLRELKVEYKQYEAEFEMCRTQIMKMMKTTQKRSTPSPFRRN